MLHHLSLLLLVSLPFGSSFSQPLLPIGLSQHLSRLCATSWSDVEGILAAPLGASLPVSIDTVLQPEKPTFSTEHPTLYRERHGWCPYSERVWLTLELFDIPYDTIRVDNTGGPRPSYFAGQTPQMRWPEGKTQGESMDLVYALNDRYKCQLEEDRDIVAAFRNIFPRARPSSRAAYLFQYNGEPLWRSTFEKTLEGTNALLGESSGPFLGGDDFSAADIAWAPFLERYRYQLPCLHKGLDPEAYPNLAAWYQAMDQIPAYACRVKGDAASWSKVLSMAGFGNSGVPPEIDANMERLKKQQEVIRQDVWEEYARDRPHVAATPAAEAALTIVRNRGPIVKDAIKRSTEANWKDLPNLPKTPEDIEAALHDLALTLIAEQDPTPTARALASFLNDRMCVPRDMGAMSAACIQSIANS